jgi:hypothetical protein
MALSALHRLQGLAPSHYDSQIKDFESQSKVLHTFDFFNRQRSQALHTRFLMLSCASIELDLCDDIELKGKLRRYQVDHSELQLVER